LLDKAYYKYPEEFDELNDDSCGSETSPNFTTTLSDIKELNDCLFGLSPYLATIPSRGTSKDSKNTYLEDPEVHPDGIQGSVYLVNIRDKFPNAPESLTETLAAINWDRHKMIREMRTCFEKKTFFREITQQLPLQKTVGTKRWSQPP
jgi:hypothetical protein